MITATLMLMDSSTSISSGGIGTMITSTLAMNPMGRMRSVARPSAVRMLAAGMAPEAIRNSAEENG